MKIEIINTDKGQIENSLAGNGTTVLLLHGGHSNCRETLFHKGFDLQKYLLITPSRPGYGNTPLNDNSTPQKTAGLLVSLLNYLKIDKVVLYAVSAGGLAAIELAAGYPERVEKLILASAVTKRWLDKDGRVYKTAKVLFNPKSERIVWGLIRFISGIVPTMVANNFYPQFSMNKSHRLDKNDIKELLLSFTHYNSKNGFMCDIDQEIEPRLITKIQCPTLIIHSRNDNSVSFGHAEHASKKIKGSMLIGLNNEWGHLFWIGKDSTDSIKKIIEFIER